MYTFTQNDQHQVDLLHNLNLIRIVVYFPWTKVNRLYIQDKFLK